MGSYGTLQTLTYEDLLNLTYSEINKVLTLIGERREQERKQLSKL
jgi:hypothetical protein